MFFSSVFEYMPTSSVPQKFCTCFSFCLEESPTSKLIFCLFSLFAYFMSQLSFLDLFKVDYFLASVFHPIVLFSHLFFFLHGISCNYFVSLCNVFVVFALHLFVWDLREAETMSNLFNFVFQCQPGVWLMDLFNKQLQIGLTDYINEQMNKQNVYFICQSSSPGHYT